MLIESKSDQDVSSKILSLCRFDSYSKGFLFKLLSVRFICSFSGYTEIFYVDSYLRQKIVRTQMNLTFNGIFDLLSQLQTGNTENQLCLTKECTKRIYLCMC